MSEAITIARPYAQAAFDHAKQAGQLKAWSEMLAAAAAAVNEEQVAALVSSPRVSAAQLLSLMAAVSGDAAGAQGGNFLHLLVDEHRLDVLPEIAQQFEQLKAEEEMSIDVTVSSAFELAADQKQKITAALKARYGREVRLHAEVDAKLLGGVVIRAGDKVIDGSARTRLAEMTSALA
jgi:F-type H+-transporting ATPase subunit delta